MAEPDQFTYPPQYTQDQPVQIGYLVDETGVAQAPVTDGWVGAARMASNRLPLAVLRTPDDDSAMDDVNDAVRVNVVAGSAGNSTRITILTSAARTADTPSSSIDSLNYRRFALIVDITANTGTISIRPQLQIQDIITSSWVTVWQAGNNLTAQGTFAYYFGDGASGGAWRQIMAFGIPGAVFRLNVVSNNGNSVSYSASGHLMV